MNKRRATLLPSCSPPPMVNNLRGTMPSVSGAMGHDLPRSLIEQPRRSGLKDVAEGAAEIIPGDRGTEGGSWCRLPLPTAKADERHMSPVPLAGVVSGQFTHESGTVRRGVIRNHAQPSQVRGKFRTADPRSHPRGYRLLLRRPERQRLTRRDDPARRPVPHAGKGRARERRGRGAHGPGKVRPPPPGAVPQNGVTPLQTRNAT